MFVIIIHIAFITCLVTNDDCHPYDVFGVYKIHHRADEISYLAEQAGNTVVDWYVYTRSGPVTFKELAILRLASTVMAWSVPITSWWGGACPSGQEAKTIGEKIYCID